MVAFIWRSGKVMWRAALRGRFPPFCHFTIGHMKTKRSKKSALLRLMAIIMRLLAKCFGEMARLYGEAHCRPGAAMAGGAGCGLGSRTFVSPFIDKVELG